MASFDENGKYIKTNWKAGDKITATKLNKIEESIEAVNDNDISRHVEADARLDALEAKDVAHDKELTKVKNLIEDAKDAAELGDYEINSRMTFLENELEDAVAEVDNVASTVDGKIAQAEADMNNKISQAETNMQNQVNQGKADMEAMVAEVEVDLEGLHAKDEELSEQLMYIESANSIYFDKYKPDKNNLEDNSDKLMLAIADCLASGKDLLISPGIYKFSKTINMKFAAKDFKIKGLATKSEGYSNIKLYFEGDGTFLNFTGCRNIHFENVEISGFNKDTETNCYRSGTIGLNIDGSIIAKDCNLNGFEIISKWNGGYYHKYINCTILYSSVCFSDYSANNLIIDKCKCSNFETFLDITGGDGPTVIRDSSFEKFTKRLFAGSSGSTSNILIEGCYIENYYNATPPSGLEGQFDKVVAISGFKSLTLIGNNICTNGIKDFIYTNAITESIISLGNRIMINKDDITTSGFRCYIWNVGNLKNVILNDVCYRVLSYEGTEVTEYIRGISSILDTSNIYDCIKGKYLTPQPEGMVMTKINSYSVSNSINDFPSNTVTMTPITATFATSESFPKAQAGVLKTIKVGNEYFGFKQEYTACSASSATAKNFRYERFVNSSNEWTEWRSVDQYKTNFYTEIFTLNANSTHDISVNVDPLVIFDSVNLVLFNAYELPQGIIYNTIKADENILIIRFLNATNSNIDVPKLRFALTVNPSH